MSEKLENKNKRRRGLPGPPLPCAAQQQQAGPARRWPSPPGPPSSVVFPPDRGTACARRSPARARATSPPAGHLLLPPDSLDAPDEATQLPRTALTLPRPPLLPLLSLPLTREPPPPPTGITVATASPTPSRHAPQIRRDPLYLLVKPRTSGRAPSPTPLSSPPTTPEIDLAAITVNSPDAGRPRAHRPALRVRREPLFLSPHLSLSRVPCSRCPASARSRRPPWPASSVPPSTSASRR